MQHSPSRFVRTLIGIACVMFVSSAHARPSEPQQVLNLGLRGVYFVPNEGQWSDREVIYGLRSRGLDVALRDSSLTMHLARQVGESTPASRGKGSAPPRIDEVRGDSSSFDAHESRGDEDSAPAWEQLTLTVTFPGSNDVEPIGAQPQNAKFNYFVGGQGRGVATDVPSFGAVIYENLYNGIDLHVMGSDDGVLKYEFHVAPGADHNQIRIHYDGIESLCIDDSGNLHIKTSFGTLADAAPVVWQTGDEVRTISGRFSLIDNRTYRIAIDGGIEPARELVIDPDVDWMLYLGGSNFDSGSGISVDREGNTLVTGKTLSLDFEGRSNEYHSGVPDSADAFVAKLDSSGQLLSMTYLGGSDDEVGTDIAVDDAGDAFVTGYTMSTDFEGMNNAHHGGQWDAFVVKVDLHGLLQWMTYLGGTGDDSCAGVAVDANGDALVTGASDSTDFDGRNNAHHGGNEDAVVAKVHSNGQLQWMTYVGGSHWDQGSAIAADGDGNALVAGMAASLTSYDVLVAKVDAAGELQQMTTFGGTRADYGYGIVVDPDGSSLVTGRTNSTDFEGNNNTFHGNEDAFVFKLDPSCQLQWMTYLGGSAIDNGFGIAVNEDGHAIVTGIAYSLDFEGSQNTSHGNEDAFAVKLDQHGRLQWMIYLGGSGLDYGIGITLDGVGNALLAGQTASENFEGRNNARHGDRTDAFVVKVRLSSGGPQLTVNAMCPSGGPIQLSWSGATPGGQIAIIFARNTGSFIIPNNRPCPGTALGLSSEQIQIAFQGSAGPDGSRTLNATTGPSACGGYLQLLDLTTCTTSNVVRIE